jgi:hypothetical protein
MRGCDLYRGSFTGKGRRGVIHSIQGLIYIGGEEGTEGYYSICTGSHLQESRRGGVIYTITGAFTGEWRM